MHAILKKILSFILCAVYIVASCGFVRHICDDNDFGYVSLLVNNECNHCLEHKTEGHACCHHNEEQTQTNDEDCCEKTIETISSDQDYLHNYNISAPVFFTVVAVVCNDTELICHNLGKFAEIYTPIFKYQTPLIYHTGQLRL